VIAVYLSMPVPACGAEGKEDRAPDELLLRDASTLEQKERLELPLPASVTKAQLFLSFDARIEAKRYKTGSNPCLQLLVNGLPTSLERLCNKRSYYFYNPEQRVRWYSPTLAAWTIPYYPWDNKTVGQGQAHRFVLDITDLLKPVDNAVAFRSTLSVPGAVVELRDVRVLWHDRFRRTRDLGQNDPPTHSRGLARFRAKALGYHRGGTAQLNTKSAYKSHGGTVAPRRSFRQAYDLRVSDSGEIAVAFGGDVYAVHSYVRFAGAAWLDVDGPGTTRGWEHFAVRNRTVTGQDPKAALCRTIVARDSHVEIRDRFTNRTDRDLPIEVMNSVDVGAAADLTEFRISGVFQERFWACTSPLEGRQFGATPVVYVERKRSALGVVVEDDAYRNQASILVWENTLGVGDDMFYLGPKASYTFVWKLFPIPDRDYFTLVNAVRRHWRLFQNIPGLFGFIVPHSKERFMPATRVEKTPEKIAAFTRDTGMAFCAGSAVHFAQAQQRLTTLYGNETVDVLRRGLTHLVDWRDKARQGAAGAQFMPYLNVHLCRIIDGATLGEAERRLPGCLIRDAFGDPVAYRQGWLYCFLPTLENACGKHLFEVLRMYVDEQGFDSIYLDEWDHSRARVSFSHEDGISALLDAGPGP